MKKNCQRFHETIAAFVTDAADLSPEAAAHVQNCPTCQAQIAQLQAVAALHRESAANLPETNRRLTRTQLENALAHGQSRRSTLEIGWRLGLAGALAVALALFLVAVLHWPARRNAEPRRDAKLDQPQKRIGAKTLEPTLLALHHSVESGREQMLAGATGSGIQQYRVKDVETELRTSAD